MKSMFSKTGRPHECGSVAIEMAIVLPLLLVFLGLPSLYLAFYFRQYSAAQKAAHDAALYLSTAPRVEMTTSGPDGSIAAVTLAKKIVEKELAGIVPASIPAVPDIYCVYRVAGGAATRPCTITYTKDSAHTLFQFNVSLGFNYVDPLTDTATTLLISPYVSVRYLGN